jgi:hypothetical protein
MTHLELENLASDYLEGLLTPVRRAEVEAHLAECGTCHELVEEVRRTMELCHTAEELEPAPWLVSKILLATVGERKPTLREQLSVFFRPVLQPRVAYTIAMAVFSFSIIINAAGINLRDLRVEDLNPRTWVYRANRAGHLFYARAEKFYYDLRIVYEIESRFRQLRPRTEEPQKAAPPQGAPPGGSTSKQPANPELALNGSYVTEVSARNATATDPVASAPGAAGAGRSLPR